MCRFERGRVVNPVAGHRNDFTIDLERLDDAELLFGHDPREHGDGFQAFGKLCVVELGEVVPGQHVAIGDTRLQRDGTGSGGIITGNHHNANARRPAFGDCCRNAWAERVGKTYEANKRKVEIAWGLWPCVIRSFCARDTQNADTPRCHRIDSGHHLFAFG